MTNEQRQRVDELNAVVRSTDQFRSANETGELVRLTTGDGMALAFFTSPDAPVRCAQEISIKESAIDYAKARAKFGHGEIRVLNPDGKFMQNGLATDNRDEQAEAALDNAQ